MAGLVQGQVLIVLVRDHDRAVLGTGRATPALLSSDVSGLLDQGYLELSWLPFHPVDIGIGQDFYVGMSVGFDEFWRFNAHGAVIGGEGLVELGHLAADGRGLVDQVNLETRVGEIERGLNTADPRPDNHTSPTLLSAGLLAHCSSIRSFSTSLSSLSIRVFFPVVQRLHPLARVPRSARNRTSKWFPMVFCLKTSSLTLDLAPWTCGPLALNHFLDDFRDVFDLDLLGRDPGSACCPQTW